MTGCLFYITGKDLSDMPIYKCCSRCGKRIPSGTTCPCIKARHKEYDRYSRDKKSKQYYDSREWEKSRAAALDADGNIDVYLFMTEGRIEIADAVHHIIPLKEAWEKRNSLDNLISLNHDTHSMIEQMYKRDKAGTQKILQDMIKEYRGKVEGGAV